MVRVFPKSANQPNEMALTICSSISRNCFRLMRDWKLESLANGKEISAIPFRTEKEEYLWGAYHLARKSGNFGLKSNGKVIFRKFRSEIVEYLQRYSSFSVRNGMAEISLPFAKLSRFQSLISRKQLREIEVQMVTAISFGCFLILVKPLPLFNARPNRFILTNGKHP